MICLLQDQVCCGIGDQTRYKNLGWSQWESFNLALSCGGVRYKKMKHNNEQEYKLVDQVPLYISTGCVNPQTTGSVELLIAMRNWHCIIPKDRSRPKTTGSVAWVIIQCDLVLWGLSMVIQTPLIPGIRKKAAHKTKTSTKSLWRLVGILSWNFAYTFHKLSSKSKSWNLSLRGDVNEQVTWSRREACTKTSKKAQ